MGEDVEENAPLYSRKLHMRVRRASTSCVTSRIILDFSFGLRVVNHLESRCVVEVSPGLSQARTWIARSSEDWENEPLCLALRGESDIWRSSISDTLHIRIVDQPYRHLCRTIVPKLSSWSTPQRLVSGLHMAWSNMWHV